MGFETDVEVILDENEFLSEENPLTVKQALEDTVSRGRIGNLKVEPSSLVLGREVRTNEGNEGKSLSEPATPNVKLYVVVACIAALVLVAIVQASCTIFKMSRRGSSVHKEKLLGQSQWKDYSAGGHPPHHPPYHYNDSFETDGDMKAGWQQQRSSYERHGGGGGGGGGGHHTHSLPRPPAQHHVATNHMVVTTRWATPRSTGEQEAVVTMVDHMVDPTTLPPTTTSCPARGSTRGRCSEYLASTERKED